MSDFKREKSIPSETRHIDTSCCGTLHLTLCWQDKRLIEVRGMIGRAGTCCNTFLNSICIILSILLQSDMARYKIIKKLKKQFVEVNCGQDFIWQEKTYKSCVDLVAQSVIKELEKQL